MGRVFNCSLLIPRRIWDANNLQVIKAFPRKQHIQTCCELSLDNNYCLTSSNGFQGNGCEATVRFVLTILFYGHKACVWPHSTGEICVCKHVCMCVCTCVHA